MAVIADLVQPPEGTELRKMRQHKAWWALNDPVAYVWLCRAERRGAIVPWTTEARR